MTNVIIKNRIVGLLPYDGWDNPKRHISALVKGGKVFAYGESTLGGRPYCASVRGRSCHSEMTVLKYIGKDLTNKRKISKYTLWNARWTRNGDLVNSKPCLHCQEVLLRIGIKNIIFSTSKGVFIKTKLASLNCNLSSGYTY
jgi:tRNA(Arg) A34 adenosine deaminase TadA